MTKSTRLRRVCKHCGSVCLTYRSRTYEFQCTRCGKITKKSQKGHFVIREHNKLGGATKLKNMNFLAA